MSAKAKLLKQKSDVKVEGQVEDRIPKKVKESDRALSTENSR